MNQDTITTLNIGAVDEATVGRGCHDKQAGCVLKTPPLRNGQKHPLWDKNMRGIHPLIGTKDLVAGL
jgi:hypothetical protein